MKSEKIILFIVLILYIFNIKTIPYAAFFILLFFGVAYLHRSISRKSMLRFGWLFLLFVLLNAISWSLSEKSFYVHEFLRSRNTTELFAPIILFSVVFFPFYEMTRKRQMLDSDIQRFVIAYFILSIWFYILSYQLMETDRDYGASNNASYFFLCCIPLTAVFWRKRLFYYLFVISLVLILFSAKRGAIIGLSWVVLVYLRYYIIDHPRSKVLAYIGVFVTIFVFVIALYYFYHYDANFYAKMEGTAEGRYSGRDEMYETMFYFWLNADTFHKIFGVEFMGAAKQFSLDAHNDWLELLISTGLCGAMVYLMFFIVALWYGRKNKRYLTNRDKFMFYAALAVWFTKSLVSMGYTSMEDTLYIIAIATVMGTVERRKQILNNR